MTAMFDPAIFDSLIFDVGLPAEPPVNWAPPLDLAGSTIIGQALRFMRLVPLSRHDPGSELLPALTDAHDQAAGSLLADADWSFASTVAHLPGSAPATLAEESLPNLATLPGDLVRIRQVWPHGVRWQIDGRTLRHDAPGGITIRYTARVTREDALPATFRTVLALTIAARLAGRFAGSGADPEELDRAATATLKQAMREDSRQASEARWTGPGLTYAADNDWALEATA